MAKKVDLEEIEKNLNYVEDMAHNMFKFDVDGMSYSEAIITFRQNLRRGNYVEACHLAEKFFQKYILAVTQSEPYTNLRKAHFNTLKEQIKNVIRDS